MAREQITQPPDSQSSQRLRAVERVERPFQVGDALPVRLTAKDMCRIFNLRSSGFYQLVKQGKFDAFELLPQIGAKAWSGERVQQYLRGEAVITRSFGRKVR